MTVALYATIWAALVCFVLGEAGKRASAPGLALGWPWRVWTLGALLCALHLSIALGARHGWSHADAAREIERRTAELLGSGARSAIFVNYFFAGLLLAECCAWRLRPGAYARRPRWLTLSTRAFYLVVIVNAAIVFASPVGRVVGVPLVAALIWIWRPRGKPRVARG